LCLYFMGLNLSNLNNSRGLAGMVQAVDPA